MQEGNTPLVSVIIPAYNQGRFLADSIRSVLAQTYTDYEIIVVDDESTDDTAAVAQQFTGQIRYIWQENQGLAGSRNTGIHNAQGEYIALLDSDDLWSPTFLQTMMAFIKIHPEGDVYYCGWTAIDEDGKLLPQTGTKVVPPEKTYETLLRVNFMNCCTVLIRRKTMIEAGLFDRSFRRLEDWELWLRLLRNGRTFVGTSNRLVYYRMHRNSLSSDPSSMQQAATAIAIKLFGVDDEQWAAWSEEKRRAYGGVYRYHVLSSVQQQNDWQRGAQYLSKAFQVDPTLSQDLDLFYELALGTQPRGYRGTPVLLTIEENAVHLLNALWGIFAASQPEELSRLRRLAFGTAYQALGLAAYNQGQLQLGRRYLLSALRYQPGLLGRRKVSGALAKSMIGIRPLKRLRSLRAELKLHD